MLQPRTRAPALSVPLVSGETWTVAERSPEAFQIIVFYRGKHCPICKGYLKTIQSNIDDVAGVGAELVAISMDGPERARATVEDWDIGKLNVGYGLTEERARTWGLYISSARPDSEEPAVFSEPGLVVLRPNAEIFFVQNQSAPFTRPPIGELVNGLRFVSENDYPARGDLTAAAA